MKHNNSPSNKINFEGNADAWITLGETGRTVKISDSNYPEEVKEALDELIKFFKKSLEAKEFLSKYINDLMKGFNYRLEEEKLICYRGLDVSKENDLEKPIIGPAPVSYDGRYNKTKEKVIYLTTDDRFLFKELGSETLLVQKYEVRIKEFNLKIADLSSTNEKITNSLGLLYAMTERDKIFIIRDEEELDIRANLEKLGKSRYFLSQLLAEPLKEKWDGMYIPGVCGGRDRRYCNLVIWGKPVEKWEEWVSGEYYTLSDSKQ